MPGLLVVEIDGDQYDDEHEGDYDLKLNRYDVLQGGNRRTSQLSFERLKGFHRGRGWLVDGEILVWLAWSTVLTY